MRHIPGRPIIMLLAAGVVFASPPASVCVFAQGQKSDWPQFRGPGGQGISPEKGLPVTWSAKDIVWKTELKPGTSSPIVVGPRIFLTAYSGYNEPGKGRGNPEDLKLHMLCLERDTGKIVWSRDVAPKLPEQAAIREAHGYASATAVADGERVYAFFGKSGVVAFDHEGRQLWRADVGAGLNGWGSAASPMLFGNLLIVNASVESESVVALDAKSGKEVWRRGGIKESWNTPIVVQVDGKPELIVAIFGKVLGLQPATGEVLWTCATGIGAYMVPSLVAHDGLICVIGGRPGGGLGVRGGGRGDVTRSHRAWTSQKGAIVSSPILHEGHLYWMHDGLSIAFCAVAATGKIVYEERVPRANQVYASPVLVDGKLYYFDRSGRTYVLAARPAFEVLAVNEPLEQRGMFNASPAVSGGRFFVRSERALYCLGRR